MKFLGQNSQHFNPLGDLGSGGHKGAGKGVVSSDPSEAEVKGLA